MEKETKMKEKKRNRNVRKRKEKKYINERKTDKEKREKNMNQRKKKERNGIKLTANFYTNMYFLCSNTVNGYNRERSNYLSHLTGPMMVFKKFQNH